MFLYLCSYCLRARKEVRPSALAARTSVILNNSCSIVSVLSCLKTVSDVNTASAWLHFRMTGLRLLLYVGTQLTA